MVRVGDLGHVAQVGRPGDGREEAVGVGHVGLDLLAVLLGERAFGHRQGDQLLVRQEALLGPAQALEHAPGDFEQPLEASLGEHGGLVALGDEGQQLVDLRQLTGLGLFLPRHQGARLLPVVMLEQAGFFRGVPERGEGADQLEAVLHRAQLVRVELLGLDQHVLAHADLAEVVQQRGVADLLDLLAGEAQCPEFRLGQRIHLLRQGHRQRRDTLGMAGSGGIP